jgi:hypothetical protein
MSVIVNCLRHNFGPTENLRKKSQPDAREKLKKEDENNLNKTAKRGGLLLCFIALFC